jgi:hypothetical protein
MPKKNAAIDMQKSQHLEKRDHDIEVRQALLIRELEQGRADIAAGRYKHFDTAAEAAEFLRRRARHLPD